MNVYAEVRAMAKMPMADLKARYAELFGEQTRSCNRDYLVRRIAWRLQARVEGDLSERARKRAAELADDAEKPHRTLGKHVSTASGPARGKSCQTWVSDAGGGEFAPPPADVGPRPTRPTRPTARFPQSPGTGAIGRI